MNTSDNLCPICKNENEPNALICRHCGAMLAEHPTNLVAINENISGQSNALSEADTFIDTALIPKGGIGIYAAGAFKPYYVSVDKELIIGRQTEKTLEPILDLSELDAFNKGVSRRHAVIWRTETGFEIVDLASRNGTWLNAERLLPNRPYPLPSGSQLRIGQIRLFIIYQSGTSNAKN